MTGVNGGDTSAALPPPVVMVMVAGPGTSSSAVVAPATSHALNSAALRVAGGTEVVGRRHYHIVTEFR